MQNTDGSIQMGQFRPQPKNIFNEIGNVIQHILYQLHVFNGIAVYYYIFRLHSQFSYDFMNHTWYL